MAPKRSHRFYAFVRRHGRDDRGVSAILFALILPLLIGMVGLGVEVGYWFSIKRNLQSAADAAAVAASFEMIEGNGTAAMQTAAETYVVRNRYPASTLIDVQSPPEGGDYITDTTAVRVILQKAQPLLFAAVFGTGSVTISAVATARTATVDEACVIALNTVINDATEITGSANVNLNGCGIAVNSSSSTALTVSGSGYFSAPSARIVGDYDADAPDFVVPNVTTNATAVTDPYASLSIGTPGACVSGNTDKFMNGITLTGTTTYCNPRNLTGSIDLNGHTLYIRGGQLRAIAGSTITGTGTIVLTTDGSDYATINIAGGANIAITAPTSGNFEGLAIVQDPNATAGNDNTINGTASTAITGALYFPRGDLTYSGNSSTVTTNCTRIIAYTVHFSGNNNLYNNCSAYDYDWPATASRPVLVE